VKDECIEILGRKDNQVKIRGFRIELGEIENTLLKHENAKECIIISGGEGDDRYLCAYVVLGQKESESDFRSYLTDLLPDYMIPSYFVELEELPLTPNGKVDRKSLPAPEIKAGADYVAPSTLLEFKLVEIWSEILNVASKEISTNVSFFELGGHSLKATILVSRIHKALEVRIDLRDVFQYPTIQEQAELINSSDSTSYFSIPKARDQEYYPLSSSQRRLYLLQQMDLGSTAYNMSGLLIVPQGQDKQGITEIFNKLIARHENFRTSFEVIDELPVQRIHEKLSFAITEYQLTKAEVSGVREYFVQSFDLSQAPLLRVGYLEISDGDDMLIFDMHHIISDGRSQAVLREDFSQLLSGKELKPLRLQYKDYSQWQNSPEQQTRIKSQESYWLNKFSGELPVLELPTDYSRPVMQSFEGASVSYVLSPEETNIIHDLNRENGLTSYMSLLSVFSILLSKLSGQEDIIVGSPIAARRHSDLEDIVGMFVNTLAIHNEVSGDKRIIDYLQELKENTLEAYENQEYQFEDLVERVDVKRDTSHNPIFDVGFNLLEGSSPEIKDRSKEELIHILGTSKFDLSLLIIDYGEQIVLNFEYCTKLFKSETIDRFIKYFKHIIPVLATKQDKKISSIELIPDEEKKYIINAFNNTRSEYCKETTIHEIFEEEVRKNPNHISLVDKGKSVTYSELNEVANQIAHYLRARGVKTENIVGIELESSFEFVVCMIGVLKSGGAYLPIDKNLPEKRKKYIIENSKLKILIHNNSDYKEIDSTIDQVNYKNIELKKYDLTNPNIQVGITNLAYVIYTSGTSGNPKGTLLEHKGIVSENTFWKEDLGIIPSDQCIQFANISFDASVWEICLCLLNGASLYIPEKSIKEDISLFENYLINNKITVATLPPAYAENLSSDSLKGFRLLVTAGSETNSKLIEKINHYTRYINAYGPTETSVCATYWETSEYEKTGKISIGKPIRNLEAYILNSNNHLQGIGMSGELCISGDGLARGYLHLPEITLEKFISHPFKDGERLYKTGDLARWLPDGNIEFLGRIDHQVKIRGFRIELGEIENTLLKHANIKESIVIALENNGDKYLCAYIVKELEFKQEEIRTYLLGLLPDYMVPTYFVEIDSIPLTSNGKVNRKSLPAPELKAGEDYQAPKTLIETKLVEIWSEILNVASKEISTNVSFFELGGHSLKATVLVSRIHKALEVRIELRDVFQSQTIQAQAELINSTESTSYFSIPKAKDQEYYPLSSAQRRLYLLQQMDLGSIAYNMAGLIAVPKGQDKQQIKDVFNKLIARHENFRTSFEVKDELPVQLVHSEVSFSITEYQITKAEIPGLHKKFVQAFDLSKAPLLRVGYFEISDGEDMLLVDMHHIISDGKSYEILEKDFYQLLEGKDLEPLQLHYKDFSEWQNSSEQQERIKGQESYWLDKYSDEIPILDLPTDYPRPAIQEYEGASMRLVLSKEETENIRAFAKENDITLYMSVLSIFTLLLSKLSGQKDIIVGSPIVDRIHSDLENIVGIFLNTLAIRNDVKEDDTVKEFVARLRQSVLGAFENQEYQFEELVENISIGRDLSRNPLIDVMFNLLNHTDFRKDQEI
ncbi:MAG: amino acid adenylation domain-containing protein, partial [Bacteroidales bacterium]|nr:amino acid adenylation domain-containing protein [Bacteroidales bacterium]